MVTPIRATLSASQPVIALTVRNDGADHSVVQVDAMTWAQREGGDFYEPTREIIATPPLFKLEPGASQVVRVGLRRAPDATRELTFRLFLEEVPPPPKPDFKGLRVALRMAVPVFVTPSSAAVPRLHWRLAAAGSGLLTVGLRNDGNAHVHVTDLRLESPPGQELVRQKAASYVLPGQSREWRLKAAATPGTVLRLVARTDDGDVQAELEPDGR